ncbi:LysR family transcriptional regulator [Kineococcus glutinatus]|uniref:LysR family transcriptional regulator n=1 Tax=Kineococcus glutinatus TaxID=1070872 RepID=A0ABP9HY73_9ACTN
MELSADDLRVFLALARHGRLVQAAAALGVDHTTVGRRITAMERAAGHRLFDRTAAGWVPTAAGRALLEPAASVEAAVQDATQRLGRRGSALSGTVRVLAPDGFGTFVLAPGLGPFVRANPDLVVEIVTATAHLPPASREFDVAVTLEAPSSARVARRHLTDYLLRLYATEEYLAANPPVRLPEDLAAHTLIHYVDALLDVPPLRVLADLLRRPPAVQSTNFVVQWQAAAAGVGIAPLPQYVARTDPRLVPVLPALEFRRRYWLAVPREHADLARVEAVTELLDAVVRERADDLLGPLAPVAP